MKRSIKSLLLAFVVMFSIILLSGCGNSKIDSKIIGTWEFSGDGFNSVYVFNGDGTGSQMLTVDENSSTNKLTYETKDGKMLITFENDTDVFEYGYRFSVDNLVLK